MTVGHAGTVVFSGNDQLYLLAQAYKRIVAPSMGHRTFHIAQEHLTATNLLTHADIVVVQKCGTESTIPFNMSAIKQTVIEVPALGSGFLWPALARLGDDGSYSTRFEPHYWPQQIVHGMTISEGNFLNMMSGADINCLTLQDALATDLMEQRRRDAGTGFNTACLIEGQFKTRQMFVAPNMPTNYLVSELAVQLLTLLRIEASLIDITRRALAARPNRYEQPIHPVVAKHLGLQYIDDSTRYRTGPEQHETFAQYAAKLWGLSLSTFFETRPNRNPRAILDQAISAESDQRWKDAETLHRSFMDMSPNDPDGPVAFARFMIGRGRLEEAAAAADYAITIAPSFPPCLQVRAEIALHANDPSNAVKFAGQLANVAPQRNGSQRLLAESLFMNGNFVDATKPARLALEKHNTVSGSVLLARILNIIGEPQQALEVLETSHRLFDPTVSSANLLAEIYEDRGRRNMAIQLLENQWVTKQYDGQTFSLLGNFLQRDGNVEGAIAAFSHGARLFPERGDLLDCLKSLLPLATS